MANFSFPQAEKTSAQVSCCSFFLGICVRRWMNVSCGQADFLPLNYQHNILHIFSLQIIDQQLRGKWFMPFHLRCRWKLWILFQGTWLRPRAVKYLENYRKLMPLKLEKGTRIFWLKYLITVEVIVFWEQFIAHFHSVSALLTLVFRVYM